MSNYIRVPKCPKCGNGMVFTFAFPYQEYACLLCNETDEFFPKNEMVNMDKEVHRALKDLWAKDLHRIAIEHGAICDNGFDCEICNDENYKYTYWKSNLEVGDDNE